MENEKLAGLPIAPADFGSEQCAAQAARIVELEKKLAASEAKLQLVVNTVITPIDQTQQVPGLEYPTTYADLARISNDALYNRWLGGRTPAGITVREAFMGARAIPHAVTFSVLKSSVPEPGDQSKKAPEGWLVRIGSKDHFVGCRDTAAFYAGLGSSVQAITGTIEASFN